MDDDPAMSRVLERAFRRAGFGVEVVPTGEHALERLRETAFDVLITETRARRLSGRELCDRIRRAAGAEGPFVFVVTPRVGGDERRWAERVPRTELVEKPVGPRTLLRLVSSRVAPSRGENADADEERVA